jgi:hypothetical protein
MKRSAITLALLTLTVAGGALAPAQASAASRISACFDYAGTRYEGLSTNVEYMTTGGGWAYLPGTRGYTESNGCVAYRVSGRHRSWYLRIKATASVPLWRGIFSGPTPHYGPAGRGKYYLGEGRLRFFTLPAAAPTAPSFGGVDTSQWLNDMTGGSNGPDCSSSTSMMVACYMDRHGLHGNVVVPIRDYDHDGWTDDRDNYPRDPLWR